MAKSLEQKISRLLKEALGKAAPPDLIEQCAPELLSSLKAGARMPLVADLIVSKVVKLALDPKKDCRWAVELIFDRTEGRAPIAAEDDRMDVVEDKLDGISNEHLNAIAEKFTRSAPLGADRAEPPTEDNAPGLADSASVGVSADGLGHSEVSDGELTLAAGNQESGDS